MPNIAFIRQLAGALGKGKVYGEEFFSPKQKDLFPELRRELVLEMEDKARSDDLLDACMERRGYKTTQIKSYQDKIAEKMTPDMFGKKEKLTGQEAMFQEILADCLESMKNKQKHFGKNNQSNLMRCKL